MSFFTFSLNSQLKSINKLLLLQEQKSKNPIYSLNLRMMLNFSFSFIQMDAQRVTTDNSVRHLSPMVRNCYFTDEFDLKIYANYSYDNCIHECKLMKAYEKYGCLPWNQPSSYTRYLVILFYNLNDHILKSFLAFVIQKTLEMSIHLCRRISALKKTVVIAWRIVNQQW